MNVLFLVFNNHLRGEELRILEMVRDGRGEMTNVPFKRRGFGKEVEGKGGIIIGNYVDGGEVRRR